MLDGVTVLDLTQQMPGPYASLLLRALGARTIKVEPPGGDPARHLDPWMFEVLNDGAESIVLDLKTVAGRDLLAELAVRADVCLEGFRPGVADRIGAGYARLSEQCPGLVYVSVSGYGQTGPYRDLPGHDLNYLGVAGGLAATGEVAETPAGGVPVGMPAIDLAAGTTTAFLVAAALGERARAGRGCRLDVAMVDLATFWSGIKSGWLFGCQMGSAPASEAPEPSYGVFRCADGRALTIAVLEDRFWAGLCDALGWDDWRAAPAFATYADRRAEGARIRERLVQTLRARPRDEWLARLWAHDVPAAPAHGLAEAREDPHLRVRGLFTERAGGGVTLAPPLPLERRANRSRRGAPALGNARDRLLAELGREERQVRDLALAGAFG